MLDQQPRMTATRSGISFRAASMSSLYRLLALLASKLTKNSALSKWSQNP